MKKHLVVWMIVICSIMFTGCESKTGYVNEDVSNINTHSNSTSVTPAPQATITNEPNNIAVEEQSEQNVEDNAFSTLKKALEGMKDIRNVSYQSFYKTIAYYNNWDDPSTRLEQYNITDSYGEIQRNPAMAHTRNHNISGTDKKFEDDLLEEDATVTFSDYYLSQDYGLYYHYDNVGQYFHEELSDDFRTMEHLEELIELFMNYPENLVLIRESEEEFEGYGDEVFYTISLNISNDQYWELIPYINSNFLTGVYDDIHYDDQTFTFIEKDLTDWRISLTLDKYYTLVAFNAYYSGMMLDGQENERYEHYLKVSLYNFNSTEVPAVPE